ncbi:MAG TPA: YitT family protein [Bacteroidales bacterium]|nr:YitT family protein [Bacteroidales bacterium]HPT02656.1 YitT family protein [Bacteroidales bacterium]
MIKSPSFLQPEKIFSANWFRSYSYIVIGTFIMACGYVLFISPEKIVPGGVYGIAIMLHHLLGLPIGLTALAFNIPLTIIGTRILGPRFGVKTVVAFVLTSVFVDLLSYFHGNAPLVEGETLVSGIFGGLLVGIGVALTFKAKATSGGSDVVAMILAKYTHRPLGQLMMIVDSSIVLLSFLAFGDWRIPLFSWITIFVIGRVVDTVMHGFSYDKTLFIVSEKYNQIRDSIITDLHRGGTFLHGEGMYNQAQKQIIFTVVNPRELSMLQEYIHRIDPDAFVAVLDAYEILGKGFKSLSEKVEDQS